MHKNPYSAFCARKGETELYLQSCTSVDSGELKDPTPYTFAVVCTVKHVSQLVTNSGLE